MYSGSGSQKRVSKTLEPKLQTVVGDGAGTRTALNCYCVASLPTQPPSQPPSLSLYNENI